MRLFNNLYAAGVALPVQAAITKDALFQLDAQTEDGSLTWTQVTNTVADTGPADTLKANTFIFTNNQTYILARNTHVSQTSTLTFHVQKTQTDVLNATPKVIADEVVSIGPDAEKLIGPITSDIYGTIAAKTICYMSNIESAAGDLEVAVVTIT